MSALPLDLMGLGFELWHLGAESQAVIAMRLLGMGGLWPVGPHENELMVAEKTAGFAAATSAALAAVSVGKRPDEVLSAAVAPLRDRTSANARRLGLAAMGGDARH